MRIWMALLGAAVAGNATAAHSPRDEWLDMCASQGEFAQIVMTERQDGERMADMVARVNGNRLMEGIIEMAFNEPRATTDSARSRAIEDFENRMYADCFNRAP